MAQDWKEPSARPATPSPGAAPPWTRGDWLIVAALVVATWAAYAPTLGYQFVYDDKVLILRNPAILSWRSIPHFFAENFIAPVFPQAPANYYRPVMLLWMLLNQKMWHFQPAGWHFTAVLVESLAAAAFYALARRILGERWAAGVAAVLFALDPIHVECVAWVMAVQEPWVALLLFSSLLCHLRGREAPRHAGAWRAASAALFALAALMKEDALVFPALIFVYEWVYHPAREAVGRLGALGERSRSALARVTPLLAVAAGYFLARLAALHGFSHAATPLATSTLLLTLPEVIGSYFHLLAWPVGLSPFYDLPYVTHPDFVHLLLPLAGVAGVLAALGLWAKRSHPVAFAAAWLLLPLLPLLDLRVFPAGEIVHDRFLYLPSAGLALLLAAALQRLRRSAAWRQRSGAWLLGGALTLALLFGAATVYYGRFWSDNLTLFRRGVAVAPGNNLANNNLANEYADRGRWEEAIPLYRRVLDRDPNYWMANYNLGYCLYRLGQLEEARHFLRRATALNPSDADGYIYFALTNLRMGNVTEAELAARRALAFEPEGRGFHLALGMILRARGQLPEALEEFRAESRLYPGESAARVETEELERELSRSTPPARQARAPRSVP